MPATELELWQDKPPPLTLLTELSLLIYKNLLRSVGKVFFCSFFTGTHHVTLTHGSGQQGEIC
jgi:hypothetical protein